MRFILCLVAVLSLSQAAMAFGQEGHEAVCQIAYHELTPKARAAVDRLIALEPKASDRLFRVGCRWPDRYGEYPDDLKPRAADHYVNVPRGTKDIDGHCYDADGKEPNHCLFKAIKWDSAVLLNPKSSDLEKLKALKFLGHWIGDLHQPLHISYADDRGGNDIKATSHGCRHKLHAVWDTCLPRALMEDAGLNTKTDRGRFGDMLWKEITPSERKAWLVGGPVKWANESYQEALQAGVGYCVEENGTCQYSQAQLRYSGGPERTVDARSAYIKTFEPTIRIRLEQAGVRLGAMLNAILISAP